MSGILIDGTQLLVKLEELEHKHVLTEKEKKMLRVCVSLTEQAIENTEPKEDDKDIVIDKLRGQLQNAVNHLQRGANGYDKNKAYTNALEQANKCLYETLNVTKG